MGDFVVPPRRRFRVVGGAISCASSDDAVQIDVCEDRQIRITWVEAPHMCSERDASATEVVCVGEVIVPLGICP